jgi:formylmethanofuran dehydrogenase subunit E
MLSLKELLEKSAVDHDHLCPRQVLGVRMGVYAAKLLQLDLPQKDKRLLVFVETDGCFADGVSAATGCSVGHRNMRVVDFGKTAVTCVDTKDEEAIRIIPRAQAWELAYQYVSAPKSRWHAQLEAYQVIPDHELMTVQRVTLNLSLSEILSRPGMRVNCDLCGEEIINEREVYVHDQVLCRSCAGQAYFAPTSSTLERNLFEVLDHASLS